MTEATAAVAPNIAPPLLKQSRLVDQTSQGPSLNEAASTLLRRALVKRYPDQQIDPDWAMIATPVRAMEEPGFVADIFLLFESLTHALVRQGFSKTTANYIEGEHFLTLSPHAETPVHLAVGMDEVTSLLNDHAPFLFIAFEQQQLDYWNATGATQPRWQELSESFKAALDIQSANGWDVDACTLARLVAQSPEKEQRTTTGTDFTNVRACLLDIDFVDGANTAPLLFAGAVVLTATCKQRDLILMYTIAGGYESFGSMAQLGESLPARIAMDQSGRTLKWRLVEPEGNIFDAVVWALITSQLDAIDALDPASQSVVARASSGQQGSSRFSTKERTRLDQLDQAIPDWLHAGSIDDLQAYSRYMTDLGALRDGAENDVFKEDDIPLIKPFAQEQMRNAIAADKTAEGATDLPLDTLRITVTHSFEAGGFTLPNPFDQTDETLGEFALHNTPPYQATIAFDDGRSVPAWLTVDYLTTMAEQVNIGDSYPKLIKRTLIDDPVRATRQKTRYTRQLPVLLPLLALECKLRRQAGIDQRGYAYLCQLMDSIAQKQPPVEHPVTIRPLAFIPRHRLSSTADTVTNMFILGPRDPAQGPCLLYRPSLNQPLMQFASPQNLLYALYQPGELRDSVLAWLDTEALSFEYAQYVFSTGVPSTGTVSQLAFEPFIHLDLTGQIDLANTPLTGDILAILHTANSQALAELADRQSVSNSERRWELLVDSGWAIFSVASNFFSGAAGTAVWVWQSVNQIQQAIDAHERADTLVEWKSIGDILLTLGIILTQQVVARRNRSSLSPFKTSREEPVPTEEGESPITDGESATPATATPSVSFDATAITGRIPASHLSTLEPGTLQRSRAGARFIALIDSFKVSAPDLAGQSVSPVSHLYTLEGKAYAHVGERWFQVIANADEPVYIVDPADPLRTGLALKYDDTSGKWHWDLKLRLRGGSPTGRVAALRRAKEQSKEKAWAALHGFMEQEAQQKSAMHSALLAVPKDASVTDFIKKAPLYLDKAMELGDGYTQALEQLEAWRQAGGGGMFYQSQLMRLTVEQHRCLGSWLRVKLKVYAQMTHQFTISSNSNTPLPRNEQIDIATKVTALNDEMIAILQTLHQSLDTLTTHSSMAGKMARDLKRLLPGFSQLDLKANEISMSYERCVRERPGAEMDAARLAINIITADAADASHELITLTKVPASADAQAGRIELLARLNDIYASVDQRLRELPAAHPEQFIQARLDRMRELVGEFHTLARERLIAELPEQDEQPMPVRPEPVPSTSQPKVKITKTRPRDAAGEKAHPSEKAESVEEVPFIQLSSTRPKSQTLSDDREIIAAALNLNLDIDDFNKRTREDAKRTGRIPADIRDMFDQQVARLTQTANDVDIVFARAKEKFPVATLSLELREGAARTRADGIASYAAMLKQRKPREAYFQWLEKNGQVEIVKDGRGRIRTKQRKDYFQEYRILDKASENKALWVVHFHYDNLTDPDEQFTTAHLKLADAYLLTLDTQTRQQLNTFDAVDNVLRRIVDPVVRDLFLKPETRNKPKE